MAGALIEDTFNTYRANKGLKSKTPKTRGAISKTTNAGNSSKDKDKKDKDVEKKKKKKADKKTKPLPFTRPAKKEKKDNNNTTPKPSKINNILEMNRVLANEMKNQDLMFK